MAWTEPRADWMKEYILKTTKLKDDTWLKLCGDEAHRQKIQDFWDKSEVRKLIVLVDSPKPGSLEPVHDFPKVLKKKSVFFIKGASLTTVTKENMSKLVRGDLPPAPVDALAALVNGLMMPMIGNSSNQQEWPGVVCTDVATHAQALQTQASVVVGQMKGQTQLPLPHDSDKLYDEDYDVTSGIAGVDELLHALETSVIKWAHQVNDVLKQDSAQPLIDGEIVGPLTELDFWVQKSINLVYINDQLHSTKVERMRVVLAEENSSYAQSLEKIIADVSEAIEECDDVTLYLDPLRGYFESVGDQDFADLPKVYSQIMRSLMLVWDSSMYYRSQRRIIVLLREIMNDFIECIQKHVESQSWFLLEPMEAVPKIQESLDLCKVLQDGLEDTRESINDAEIAKGDGAASQSLWTFKSDLVTGRLEQYRKRLEELMMVAQVRVDYEKLEKVELSDPVHSKQVHSVFAEFNELFQEWTKLTGDPSDNPDAYDVLDPSEARFEAGYKSFSDTIDDFDRRLASIANLAFAEQLSLEGRFKLIHGFQGLLHAREVLNTETAEQYPAMIVMFEDELNRTKACYDEHLKVPTVAKNMPTVAGALAATNQMRHRLKALYESFQQMKVDTPEFATEDAEIAYAMYLEMLKLLNSADSAEFSAWASSVGQKSDVNLNRPLLVRDDETRLISINFDPQLVAVLREVKYLERKHNEEAGALPDEAAAIFARNEVFRQYNGNLGITTVEYNRIQTTLLDVEAPLIVRELTSADDELEKAIKQLNWNGDGVANYCVGVKDRIYDLSTRLQEAKANVENISNKLAEWFAQPMLTRDEKTGLVTHHDRAKKLKGGYAAVEAGAKEFYRHLKQNAKLLRADPKSKIWETYVDYIDNLVLDGLFNVVFKSQSYLLDHMDSADAATTPLMHGTLELQAPDCLFRPGIADTDATFGPMLMDWVMDLVSDFFRVGELIPRLARHQGKDNYREDLEASDDLKDLKEELEYKVHSVVSKALDFQEDLFAKYKHLWTEDREAFMDQFLKYAHVLTPEEVEAWKEEHPDDPFPETPPTLVQFKEQIDKYNAIKAEVDKIDDTAVFDQWYRVDLRPFRTSLTAELSTWSRSSSTS
jgi:dynein heavy chain